MHSIRISRPQIQPDYDVRLPMSKSIVNRMLVLSPKQVIPLLKSQECICDDLSVMANALEIIGENTASGKEITIDLHASGTAMRFLTAVCAVTHGKWILTGSHRLCQRPVKPLVDALRSAGADIRYLDKDGFPPLKVTCNGGPKGGRVEIDGSESSQFVSALMLVADKFKEPLNIYIKGVAVSVPYIEMTKQLIHSFNESKPLILESDWSAAAFWLEIKVLMRRFTDFNPDGIRLSGLSEWSLQGDKVAAQLFMDIEHGSDLLTWNFRNCPDLVQPAVVCCSMMGRPFRFDGIKNLRLKETDRVDALMTELGKMGVQIKVDEDSMSLNEPIDIHDTDYAVDTYNDHRMAMAFAACALKFGDITINAPETVMKSYPTFWQNLESAGFRIIALTT